GAVYHFIFTLGDVGSVEQVSRIVFDAIRGFLDFCGQRYAVAIAYARSTEQAKFDRDALRAVIVFNGAMPIGHPRCTRQHLHGDIEALSCLRMIEHDDAWPA